MAFKVAILVAIGKRVRTSGAIIVVAKMTGVILGPGFYRLTTYKACQRVVIVHLVSLAIAACAWSNPSCSMVA